MSSRSRVCPVELARGLEAPIRRILQNPKRILGRYVREGMVVLDVGCGPGFFTIEMARMVGDSGKVIAADLQQGMLDRLERRIRGTELERRIVLHKCDEDNIGVMEKVDLVLAFFMVHEVPDQERFLREIGSILRPDGILIIAEPKVHVTKREFDETIQRTVALGFDPHRRMKVFIGRAVVLRGGL